jgi:hypothetical protein
MHGTIFLELKKFAAARVPAANGVGGWERILDEAALGRPVYLPIRAYPDEELARIVAAASALTGIERGALLEDFGFFIAPDLLAMYRPLLRPEWKTLEVVLNAETTAHRAVRLQQPEASPPYLQAERTGDEEVTITYVSTRRMCEVARGIVRGLAGEFGERVRIDERSCMHRGDASCELVLTRIS